MTGGMRQWLNKVSNSTKPAASQVGAHIEVPIEVFVIHDTKEQVVMGVFRAVVAHV